MPVLYNQREGQRCQAEPCSPRKFWFIFLFCLPKEEAVGDAGCLSGKDGLVWISKVFVAQGVFFAGKAPEAAPAHFNLLQAASSCCVLIAGVF